jgi:hypothetical protein
VGAPAFRRGDKKDSRESKVGPAVDFDITPFVFVPVPPRWVPTPTLLFAAGSCAACRTGAGVRSGTVSDMGLIVAKGNVTDA